MSSPFTYVFILHLFVFLSHSFPLSTSSRWIVDENTGDRVKLACVNWPGHLHVMIPEGLNKRPMKDIVSDISHKMGFNCVRLTWATYMYTRYSNLTVSESLDRWNLTATKEGVRKNNPEVLEMSIVEAQNAVVKAMGKGKIMVVLDNHISLPEWCCGYDDGNGFFGDEYFNPDEWVRGLVAVACRYKGNPSVVAMSMRNELRGPRQNVTTWYEYMQQGGAAIHHENPDILVIFSGLSYDTNLGFLKTQPLTISLDNKLVFESHWYSFGQPYDKWIFQTNDYCATVTKLFMDNSGFLLRMSGNAVPLFLSEFGLDQRGGNEMENRYFVCLLATVAEIDIDWALWQLPGSYMLREGKVDMEDVYGMYDFMWEKLRNSTMVDRLRFVQTMIQGYDHGPSSQASYILYHPLSGQCVGSSHHLSMTSCRHASHWIHEQDGGPIQLKNTNHCLTTVKQGMSPIISHLDNCSTPESSWNVVSSSKHHLASKDSQRNNLCLEVDASTLKIVTNKCLCLDDDLRDVIKCDDNPQSQWLKLIPVSRMDQ
ncbi:putative cellulase [Helianthus annuus]|uniref:Cellulase n=1 Tax=Helianthus annuus TaxID=4232 RepID=A0A251VCK2_HELAN|nr:glycosyl hydrolase 5 family protein [Helianthus annuus]KAF5816024.1 putative cellulase [Helianthus annuus]KAJ0602562.1 putative cellulase [Helianthus annuus]KAJ0609425.1 putative cellulase [Helianthus annuus]KAJ0769486.1 putative cellulase [Helianthus annuus]KAJ0937356.1 putative cellulase [Helianthus annuus]